MIEVIIPCRNAPEILWLTLAHYFGHAHDPALVQAVTLLDNCSAAPGMAEVLRYAQYRGARVIRHERNVGVWASVNRGLALARSPRVLVLTSDVLLSPHAVRLLSEVMDQAPPEIAFLGPTVVDGLSNVPCLATLPETAEVDVTKYNGACWLMNWAVLKERVGWFDPRYCVCYGDTDYAERIRKAGLQYGVVTTLPCVHLDKQTRRHDHTVEEDTDMEIRDGARFRDKWREHPDVLARHPEVERQKYLYLKRGWKEAIPA